MKDRGHSSNIMSYKTLEDLEAVVKDMRLKGAEYETVHDDDEWTVYDLKNKASACALGTSSWCVSRPWQTHWESYTDEEDWRFLMFQSKKNPSEKYLLYEKNGTPYELKDRNNNDPDADDVERIRSVAEELDIDLDDFAETEPENITRYGFHIDDLDQYQGDESSIEALEALRANDTFLESVELTVVVMESTEYIYDDYTRGGGNLDWQSLIDAGYAHRTNQTYSPERNTIYFISVDDKYVTSFEGEKEAREWLAKRPYLRDWKLLGIEVTAWDLETEGEEGVFDNLYDPDVVAEFDEDSDDEENWEEIVERDYDDDTDAYREARANRLVDVFLTVTYPVYSQHTNRAAQTSEEELAQRHHTVDNLAYEMPQPSERDVELGGWAVFKAQIPVARLSEISAERNFLANELGTVHRSVYWEKVQDLPPVYEEGIGYLRPPRREGDERYLMTENAEEEYQRDLRDYEEYATGVLGEVTPQPDWPKPGQLVQWRMPARYRAGSLGNVYTISKAYPNALIELTPIDSPSSLPAKVAAIEDMGGQWVVAMEDIAPAMYEGRPWIQEGDILYYDGFHVPEGDMDVAHGLPPMDYEGPRHRLRLWDHGAPGAWIFVTEDEAFSDSFLDAAMIEEEESDYEAVPDMLGESVPVGDIDKDAYGRAYDVLQGLVQSAAVDDDDDDVWDDAYSPDAVPVSSYSSGDSIEDPMDDGKPMGDSGPWVEQYQDMTREPHSDRFFPRMEGMDPFTYTDEWSGNDIGLSIPGVGAMGWPKSDGASGRAPVGPYAQELENRWAPHAAEPTDTATRTSARDPFAGAPAETWSGRPIRESEYDEAIRAGRWLEVSPNLLSEYRYRPWGWEFYAWLNSPEGEVWQTRPESWDFHDLMETRFGDAAFDTTGMWEAPIEGPESRSQENIPFLKAGAAKGFLPNKDDEFVLTKDITAHTEDDEVETLTAGTRIKITSVDDIARELDTFTGHRLDSDEDPWAAAEALDEAGEWTGHIGFSAGGEYYGLPIYTHWWDWDDDDSHEPAEFYLAEMTWEYLLDEGIIEEEEDPTDELELPEDLSTTFLVEQAARELHHHYITGEWSPSPEVEEFLKGTLSRDVLARLKQRQIELRMRTAQRRIAEAAAPKKNKKLRSLERLLDMEIEEWPDWYEYERTPGGAYGPETSAIAAGNMSEFLEWAHEVDPGNKRGYVNWVIAQIRGAAHPALDPSNIKVRTDVPEGQEENELGLQLAYGPGDMVFEPGTRLYGEAVGYDEDEEALVVELSDGTQVLSYVPRLVEPTERSKQNAVGEMAKNSAFFAGKLHEIWDWAEWHDPETEELKQLKDLDMQGLNKVIHGGEKRKREYEENPQEARAIREIFDGKGGKITRYDSKDALALDWGGASDWCTSKWGQTYWESYAERGNKLYAVEPEDGTGDNRAFLVAISKNGRLVEVQNLRNRKPSPENIQIVRELLKSTDIKEKEGGSLFAVLLESMSEEQAERHVVAWNAAGFSEEEAVEWLQNGFDNWEDAELLRDAEITAADAGDWANHGITNSEQIIDWYDVFPATLGAEYGWDAIELIEKAYAWMSAGIDSEDAKRLVTAGILDDRMVRVARDQEVIDEVIELAQSPAWKAKAATDAAGASKIAIELMTNAGEWGDGVDTLGEDYAKAFARVDELLSTLAADEEFLTDEIVSDLMGDERDTSMFADLVVGAASDHISKDNILEWSEVQARLLGPPYLPGDPEDGYVSTPGERREALGWARHFSPEEAEKWWGVSIPVPEEQDHPGRTLKPGEAHAYAEYGFTPEEAAQWEPVLRKYVVEAEGHIRPGGGFKVGPHAAKWRDAGFTPEDTQAWAAEHGLIGASKAELRSDSGSPFDRPQLQRHRLRPWQPEEAQRQRGRELGPGDESWWNPHIDAIQDLRQLPTYEDAEALAKQVHFYPHGAYELLKTWNSQTPIDVILRDRELWGNDAVKQGYLSTRSRWAPIPVAGGVLLPQDWTPELLDTYVSLIDRGWFDRYVGVTGSAEVLEWAALVLQNKITDEDLLASSFIGAPAYRQLLEQGKTPEQITQELRAEEGRTAAAEDDELAVTDVSDLMLDTLSALVSFVDRYGDLSWSPSPLSPGGTVEDVVIRSIDVAEWIDSVEVDPQIAEVVRGTLRSPEGLNALAETFQIAGIAETFDVNPGEGTIVLYRAPLNPIERIANLPDNLSSYEDFSARQAGREHV
jgi:hypothetical protein